MISVGIIQACLRSDVSNHRRHPIHFFDLALEYLHLPGGDWNLPAEYTTPLRELRERQNLTREELGTKAAVPVNTISAIEEGRVAPSDRTGIKLAKGLGVGVHEIAELVASAVNIGSPLHGRGDPGPR